MDFDIAARNGVCAAASWIIPRACHRLRSVASQTSKGIQMSKAEDNKAIVGRWFTEFWGKTYNLGVVDELAAPDMLLQYSLHEPRRGRDDIKAFMTDFRRAFPDLNFWGTADLIAEGDYVVGQWEGGGTHTGPALCRRLMTIPGVGPVVALTYRVTVDVPARFRNSKAVGAVFGLTPSKYQSGQNDRTGAISRCGDEMMRVMLYEAAQILSDALGEVVLAQGLGDEDCPPPRAEEGDRGAGASAGRDHAPHVG